MRKVVQFILAVVFIAFFDACLILSAVCETERFVPRCGDSIRWLYMIDALLLIIITVLLVKIFITDGIFHNNNAGR